MANRRSRSSKPGRRPSKIEARSRDAFASEAIARTASGPGESNQRIDSPVDTMQRIDSFAPVTGSLPTKLGSTPEMVAENRVTASHGHLDDETSRAFFDSHEADAQHDHVAAPNVPLELRFEAAPLAPRLTAAARDALERRIRFRKLVSAIVGGAATLVLVAAAQLAVARDRAHVELPTQAAAVTLPDRILPVEPAYNEIKPSIEAHAQTGTVAATPAAAKDASEHVAPGAAPAPSAPEGAAMGPTAGDINRAKGLTKAALMALEHRNFEATIENAGASIEADPSDANPYLYWGTALIETGKSAESKKIFARCVANATRGPKGECAYFR